MANEHIGRRREIGWIVEATRGTVPTLTGSLMYPHDGFDFKPVIEKVADESAMGSIPARQGADIVKEYSQGSVPFILQDSMLTDLSRMVMGQAGTVVSTVTTYAVLDSNIHNSYSIITIDPVAGKKAYCFGMLNNLTINANRDEYITGTAEFIAGKEAAATYTTPAYASATRFNCADITIKLAANYAGLGAASATALKNVQLNVEKNVDIDFSLGSTTPTNIYNQQLGLTGSLTGTFNTTTLKALGLAETTQAVQIDISNGAWKWTWIMPSVDFSDWTPANDKDAYVTETLTFNTNYGDKTNGFLILKVEDL